MRLAIAVLLAVSMVQPPLVITGVIVDNETRGPVAGAVVVLAANEGALAHSALATTDVSGAFMFRGVPAGTYRLVVAHDAYLKQLHSSVLAIAPGATLPPVTISLVPTSVITGTVFGEFGDPAEGVYVRALRTDGSVAATAQTNDLGEYRLFGLAPGTVTISAGRYTAPRLDANAQLGGRAMGAAYIVPTAPCADCQGEGQSMMQISALTRTGAFVDPRALTGRSSVVVYFDGTTDRAAARAIDVTPGGRLAGIDLRLAVK